ncbi:MAG TPA: glycoside hydrolase family 76 protein [Solirubrobacterales bacterium]|nr:glycoside hydrolase family 76 protein [Solirubrobacterales bacterium]
MSFVRRSSITALIALTVLAVAGIAVLPGSASALSRSQAHYLAAANKGVKQAHRWWSPRLRWYRAVLDQGRIASLWGIVPLFEAVNGLQIAQPSRRHRAHLNRFAHGAERYLNRTLEPVPGFGPKPGQRNPGKTTWFDDNGWWGLAFLDAYRATGDPRYLNDAMIAQRFISVSGWDTTPGRPGGIWWNTNHSFYAGESLAGGTLLSARLYALTHQQSYLDDALKFIAWGDVWLTDPSTGLYARLRKPKTYKTGTTSGGDATAPGSPVAAAAADQRALIANPDEAAKLEASGMPVPASGEAQSAFNNYPPFAPSPMPYVNGPMILAHRIICEATGTKSFCDRAADLAARTLQVYQRFWMGPQFDFWYVRTMLEYAQMDNSSNWYGIIQRNARSALHRARDRHGLYLRTWYGKKAAHANAPKGSVQLHSANAALFAWMAALGR